jgi:transcriptional regulator with XRE-family HTH domain
MEKNEKKGVKITGEYLRDLRKKKGLTLQQVADALGVTPGHISNIERDLRGIGGPLLIKMAQFYGLPVEDFVEEETPPTNAVDLIAELYKADYVLYEGQLIDVRDEGVAWRIETAIRMGIAWALQLPEERKKFEEEEKKRRRKR